MTVTVLTANVVHPPNSSFRLRGTDGHEIDVPPVLKTAVAGPHGGIVIAASNLRRVDDDGDARDVSSWDECPWRPREVTT